MRPRRNQPGFTFVELIISMAVVLVLVAVVLGPSDAAARRKKLATCAETLRKLNLSLTLYANEHDGAFPSIDGARKSGDALRLLVPTYTSDESILRCPGGGYAYVMGLKNKDAGILVADRVGNDTPRRRAGPQTAQGNHEGQSGNVLFADGHVEQFGTLTLSNLRLPPQATLLNP